MTITVRATVITSVLANDDRNVAITIPCNILDVLKCFVIIVIIMDNVVHDEFL